MNMYSQLIQPLVYFLLLASPVAEVAWILISIVNSSYTSIWDIKMDWGLLDVNSSNFLLRDDLVFYKWVSKQEKEEELVGIH